MTELALQATGLTDNDMASWAGCPELVDISLSESHLTGEGLRGLRNCEALWIAQLSSPLLRDAAVENLQGLRYLQSLSIAAGSGVTDQSFKVLARLVSLTNLSTAGTDVSDAGLKYLNSGVAPISDLRLVDARRITDAGLAHLAALRGLRTLTLDGAASITGKGLRSLAMLPNLQSLSLGGIGPHRCRIAVSEGRRRSHLGPQPEWQSANQRLGR